MHECPNCGQACDCIGDDTWDDSKLAAKLERILDRRGVTIEEETDTSVPSVRRKASRKGRKAVPARKVRHNRRHDHDGPSGKD